MVWSVIFTHLILAFLLASEKRCCCNSPRCLLLSPCGINHSDEISCLSSLSWFSLIIFMSLAFSFGCGTKWAKSESLLSSARDRFCCPVPVMLNGQPGDCRTHYESGWLKQGMQKKSLLFSYGGSRWLLFNILLLLIVLSSFVCICLKSVSLEFWIAFSGSYFSLDFFSPLIGKRSCDKLLVSLS